MVNLDLYSGLLALYDGLMYFVGLLAGAAIIYGIVMLVKDHRRPRP